MISKHTEFARLTFRGKACHCNGYVTTADIKEKRRHTAIHSHTAKKATAPELSQQSQGATNLTQRFQ
ncbi:hypothetical protein PG995_010517 [Apiospora arundinis]